MLNARLVRLDYNPRLPVFRKYSWAGTEMERSMIEFPIGQGNNPRQTNGPCLDWPTGQVFQQPPGITNEVPVSGIS